MKIPIDKKRLLLYVKIGVAYMILMLVTHLPEKDFLTFLKKIVNNFWLTSYVVALNLILFEFVLPFIRFRWKRLIAAPFLLFAMLMLYSFGFYAWRHLGIQAHIYFQLVEHPNIMKGVEYHVPYSLMSAFFFGIILYTYDLRKLKESAQLLRIEKQQAELNYLKSQTNPHFLFNTLNNIYSLARDKSDLAPESILRLSKILRFMLYETTGKYIAIEQEIQIIGDYIALEKLRYDETLRLNFNHDVEDMKQAVPPLLLMPLVENAFKHGVSETRGRAFIDIHLSIRQRQLHFVVKNSSEKTTVEKDVKENIGLSNLRRQLELLYTGYELTVQQEEFVFTSTLKINLGSHV